MAGSPPIDKAEVAIPADPTYFFAALRLLTSVQFVPFQDSVFAVSGEPPAKANADVLLDPTPPKPNLVSFKSLTSVQFVPFHDSVISVSTVDVPPKANADV